MKKFRKLIPFLILALLVLSLSGCNGSSSSSITTNDDTTTDSDTTTSGGSATVTTETRGEATVTKIVLSTSSSSSANVAANSVKHYNCVWNITPETGEYWTYDGNTYDDEEELQADMGLDSSGVYIAHDIRYVPNTLEFSSNAVNKELNGQDTCYVAYYSESLADGSNYILAALPTEYNGQQNVALSTVKAGMTHSASDAYNNPVLHITKPGFYELSGTWNGQIWVDIPDKSVTSDKDTEDDSDAWVTLILDGLTVNCTVAPALVFKNVYEHGDSDSSSVAAKWKSDPFSITSDFSENVGAGILLAAGSTNSLTGTNVARMNKLKINEDDYTSSNVGQYVKAQKKLYKLDAALHSRMSLLIDNYGTTDGTLNITSTNYEGLGSELHMLIESGKVTVSAADDGINVNEDDVSVFTQTGGTLTITSTYGDGIDSNGYVALKNCTLNITAGQSKQNSAGEAGIDAEKDVKIESTANYTWTASSSSNGGGNPREGGNGGPGNAPTPPNNGNFPGQQQ